MCFRLGRRGNGSRTGDQYKAGLNDGRVVWLGEGKVSVAEDPLLAAR
jgi:hypothetical protein